MNVTFGKRKSSPLKEGTLLTNVFNRFARSCFYTAAKYCDGSVCSMTVDKKIAKVVLDTAEKLFTDRFYYNEFL